MSQTLRLRKSRIRQWPYGWKSKNRGKTPKMDGENTGKPPLKWDDLGGENPDLSSETSRIIIIHKNPQKVSSKTSAVNFCLVPKKKKKQQQQQQHPIPLGSADGWGFTIFKPHLLGSPKQFRCCHWRRSIFSIPPPYLKNHERRPKRWVFERFPGMFGGWMAVAQI